MGSSFGAMDITDEQDVMVGNETSLWSFAPSIKPNPQASVSGQDKMEDL